MKSKNFFFSIIPIIILCFIFISCDDFNLMTGANGGPPLAEVQKLIATDPDNDDFFGMEVSISGDYAIVGAMQEDGAVAGSNRGAAYIYHRTGANTWDSGVKIIATDPVNGDYFGCDVSISGDYAIVGAYLKNGVGTDSGAAYIYHRTGTNTWDSGVRIISPDMEDNDWFGFDVAIYGYNVIGDFAIITTPFKNGAGLDRGAAYIYYRTGKNTWVFDEKITASDIEDEDFYGESVATSGDYAIIGSYQEDSAGADSGAAYILE